MPQRIALAVLLLWCAAPAYAADEAALPPGDAKPVLQLEAGGPTAAVTALLFSPDGKTLYAAGLDKVVRVWEQSDPALGWSLKRSFRVPIGPGVSGAINALALSPDGRWLAVGGRSVMRGESEFRQPGLVVPIEALSETMWRDGGTIHVFDLRNPAGGKVLRGHEGEVRALAFAPARPGKPPLLVSAAIERGAGKPFGSVRLWDVEKGGDALTVLKNLPARPEGPNLAVWHTGDGKTNVRVAIAWPETDPASEEGKLCLWDAAAKEEAATLQAWASGPWNSTVALLGVTGNEARVVTGSVSQFGEATTSGGLRVWSLSGDADAKAKYERQLPFIFERLAHRPLALTALTSRDKKGVDAVAAVLQSGKENQENVLALTDVASNPAAVQVRFALKNSDPIHAPVIAASPDGNWLAVAGFLDRAIEIYSRGDLLANKTIPKARLHSEGVRYAKAVFVRRDKETGLWLSEDARSVPLQEGAVFSFDQRKLTNEVKGWKSDTANQEGWQVRFERETATVTQGDKAYPKLSLQPGQQPTWYAVRPATAQHPQILLAVAHTNRQSAETYITLFDVASGRALRQYTGHLQDVRWLAFSETQPLLVSASEDQTVSVWSFADLNAGVGMIQGLVVGERDGKVVARAIEANSAAAKAGLKSGDVIEGFALADNKMRAVASAVDFYWTVNLKKPGETVDVKLAGQAAAVRVVVGPGVEERKPLLTLFVTRDKREWIGWTPGGPFDRSSDKADSYLGWHVNTGKPEQPATFAAAREYQDEFYKQNLLKYLVAAGTLSGALKEWEKIEKAPPPEPEVSADIEGAKRALERADLFQTRQKNLKLTAALNSAYPVGAKDGVSWQAVKPDGEKLAPQPMKKVNVRLWEADLSALPWKQGDFRIEVLFASERRDQKASQTLTVRYQPPAPELSARAADKDIVPDGEPVLLTVMEPKISVQVKVSPEAGQSVMVRSVQAASKEALKPRTVAKAETYDQEFTLSEGVNTLEIVAVNQDALKSAEAAETTALRFQVKYEKPEKQPPPILAALTLTPAASESFRTGDGQEVFVVITPKLEVAGGVEAGHPLTVVDWQNADEKATSLLDPKNPQKLIVRQPLTLEPGKTTAVRLRAATKTSETAETTLRVIYRPLLPRITLARSEEGANVFRNETTVNGLFQPGTANEPYEMALMVTDAAGKSAGKAKVEVDEAKGQWTAVVPLAPGVNTIEATVRSAWRSAVSERLNVTYKRPPELEALEKIKVGETPFITIVAKVWSPRGVKPTAATLDGLPWPVEFQETEQIQNDRTQWIGTLKNVPVRDGEAWLKSLSLNIRNVDGYSLQPRVVEIAPPDKPKPKPAPLVKLQIPDQDTVQSATYRVPFFVQSDSPLQRVELWRGEELLHSADLQKVAKNGEKYELSGTVDIALDWETNRLYLLAVNDGGRVTTPEAVVSLPRPPVRVVIDHLDILDKDNQLQVIGSQGPRAQTMEQVNFDEVPRGFVMLHGRIEWADDQAEQLEDKLLQVFAYVNGSRQFPVALAARGTGAARHQRLFHVLMTLSKPKDNLIVIELPGLKQQDSSRRQFTLDCAQPQEKQRLHVLIVGVNVKDGEALKRNMLSLFDAKPPRFFEGEFSTPSFHSARLAGVLYDNVQKEAVIGQLGEIVKHIRVLQQQTNWQNDLVVVWYQGSQTRDANGKLYLKTTLNERFPKLPLERTAIAYKDLPQLPGVQITMLNVTSAPESKVSGADREFGQSDRYAARLCYVCRDAAETIKADPALLSFLKAAKLKFGTLGEMGANFADRINMDSKAIGTESHNHIPDAVADRTFSRPR